MPSAGSTELPVDAPIVEMDSNDPTLNCDPYSTIESWREQGPVVFNRTNGRYLVLSYRGCQKVLTKLAEFDSQHPDKQAHFLNAHGGITMEAVDDRRRHYEMRSIWQSDFERSALEDRYRPVIEDIVTRQVDPMVERLRAGETIDVIPDVLRDIPAMAISAMLGIDIEMGHDLGKWSDDIAAAVVGERDHTEKGKALLAQGAESRHKLHAYVAGVVDEHRSTTATDNLISKLVYSDFARAEMSQQEVVSSSAQLVLAGNETTSRLMSVCLAALGTNPDQRRLLLQDRGLVPQAVNEIHRWKTVVQAMPRNANSDESTVEGVRIPRGVEVWAMLGAANRDPDRWERPSVLDITREPKQHMGFAHGIHICLGLNLARLETEILINHILDKIPNFELAEPVKYGLGYPFPAWSPLSVVIG
jgi:cytochrome P450